LNSQSNDTFKYKNKHLEYMVIGFVEILVAILAVFIAITLYKIVKTVTHLVINVVMGALMIIAANFIFGANIAMTWIVAVVIALSGSIGALIIIALHFIGIGF
jgi:hypothetical protein